MPTIRSIEVLNFTPADQVDVLRPECPAGGPGSPGSLAEVLRASLAAARDRKASA